VYPTWWWPSERRYEVAVSNLIFDEPLKPPLNLSFILCTDDP